MLGSLLGWEALSAATTAQRLLLKPWVGPGGHGMLHGAMAVGATRWLARNIIDLPAQTFFGVKPFAALEELTAQALSKIPVFGKSGMSVLQTAGLVTDSFGTGAQLTGKAADILTKKGLSSSAIYKFGKDGAIKGMSRGYFGKALFNKELRQFSGGFGRYAAGKVAGAAFGMLNIGLGVELATLPFTLAEAFEGWNPSDSRYSNSFNNPMWGMHQGAATQRQAALSALHNSQMQVRAVLGNEAGFIHR